MSDRKEQKDNIKYSSGQSGAVRDPFAKKAGEKDDRDRLKNNFTDTLHSVQEIMKTSEAGLSKEEIASYFNNMELSGQQQEMIYQYLHGAQEEMDSEIPKGAGTGVEAVQEPDTNDEIILPDTVFFRMYLEDLQQIPQCTQEEEELLYERLAAGDESSVQEIAEQWMHQVLQIAKKQMAGADPKDFADIIQEGNMGVFLALQQMLGSGIRMDLKKELSKAARNAMEEYMQKTSADADMDQSLLAKTALVYEAQKFLTGQLQRLPTTAELSQYTKLPETELEALLAVMEKKK